MSFSQYATLYDVIGFFCLTSLGIAVFLLVSIFLSQGKAKQFLLSVATGVAFGTASELFMNLTHLQQSMVASEAGFVSFAFSHFGLSILGLSFFYPLFYYLVLLQFSKKDASIKPFIGLSFLMGILGYFSLSTVGIAHWLSVALSTALWLLLSLKFRKEVACKRFKYSGSIASYIKVHNCSMLSWFFVLILLYAYPYLQGSNELLFYTMITALISIVLSKFVFSLTVSGLVYDKQ